MRNGGNKTDKSHFYYIRYALFVLFWLIWLAMFVGAVLIVVLSPKCNADVKTQVKWYENLVNYQVIVLRIIM